MNTTPRLLNRLVLAGVGLVLLGAGTAGVLLLVLPGAATWWRSTASQLGRDLDTLRDDTTLEGQTDTWLWLVLAAALVLFIVLLVLWIMAQGRGRTGFLLEGGPGGESAGERGRGGTPSGTGAADGTVTISAAAAEQLLRAALLERPDVVGAAVSTWSVRGVPGLRVRVHPRKGTPPYAVAGEVSKLVRALDAVTGVRPPVLISISAGSRVRFSRTERVS